jgi:oligopeptidase B
VSLREQGVEYSLGHQRGGLYVLSNHGGAENFALWRAPLDGITVGARETWVPIIEHRDDTRLEALEAFTDHLIVHLRHAGLTGIRILDRDGAAMRELATPEPVYSIGPGMNAEYETSTYRFTYQSLVTPPSVFQEELATGERVLLKQQPVLGGYDPATYTSAREWATADDGTLVPISLVWRPDALAEGPAPCVLWGYGAYEASTDPWFSAARLSLLDRGVVFAIAHVRGGGEMGRRWYEDGKFGNKVNSFTDFVACARHLVATGRTAPEQLAARGGSAGGLLVGAVANLAPELFRAIAAQVPFVDPLNTLLDPTLPLTVVEWEEWGNPVDDEQAYRWIKGYSPYENVRSATYPAILATAGLNDPRVGFHEPAKWVARLRDRATSSTDEDRPILLKVEHGAGHGGPSGRYEAWREEAFTLAFLLDAIGATAAPT